MTLPAFLRAPGDGSVLAIKLQSRASRNAMGEPLGEELKIKITAPPVDSVANEALVRWLAEIIGCPRGAVQLVRGQTSRQKTVAITGVTPRPSSPAWKQHGEAAAMIRVSSARRQKNSVPFRRPRAYPADRSDERPPRKKLNRSLL